ncbi:hypothetical protein Tco_1500263 [Tanacetum coccineum]
MVASISMWSMRSSQEEIDVYEAYATQEAPFSLKIHYTGCFTESPGRKYVNGDFDFFDCIDIDEYNGDPLMGQDFDPFFGLDSAPVDDTNTPTTKADCMGKGKGIALDDSQVDVLEYVDWNEAAEDENKDGDGSDSDSDGYSSESDGLVYEENELVDVEVDMDGFDRANDNTMGNKGTIEFNADEDFDIKI